MMENVFLVLLLLGNITGSRKIDYICEEISFVTTNCKVYNFFIGKCVPWDLQQCPEPVEIPFVGYCPCFICTRLNVTIAVGGCAKPDGTPPFSHTLGNVTQTSAEVSTGEEPSLKEAFVSEVNAYETLTALKMCHNITQINDMY